VSWWGEICADQRNLTAVFSFDVLPTVLDIARTSPGKEPDGQRLKGIFLYGAIVTHHEFLFSITLWRSFLALRLLGGNNIIYTGELPLR